MEGQQIPLSQLKGLRECLDIDPVLYLAQLINLRGPGRTRPHHMHLVHHVSPVSRFAIWPQVASADAGVISS